MSFEIRTYDDIYQDLVSRVVARTELNDVRDGSPLAQLLGSVAASLYDQELRIFNLRRLRYWSEMQGEDLDEAAAEVLPDGMARTGARYAQGSGKFTRSTGGASVTIPAGTIVQNVSTGKQYKSLADSVFAVGATSSGVVSWIAVEPGAEGNCIVGAITKVVTQFDAAYECSNVTALSGGTDEESDHDFVERIKVYLRGIARSVPDAILAVAAGVTDEDGRYPTYLDLYTDTSNPGLFTLWVDDGTGTLGDDTESVTAQTLVSSAVGGEFLFWLNKRPMKTAPTVTINFVVQSNSAYTWTMPWGQLELVTPLSATDTLEIGAYTAHKGVIRAVQIAIDGDSSDRPNNPTYVGGGIIGTVASPTLKSQTLNIRPVYENNATVADVQSEITTDILAYVNRLGRGAPLVLAKIIEIIMSVEDAADVAILSPTVNVYPAKTEVIRMTADDITYS